MKYQKRSVFGWGSSGASHATPRKGLVIHYDGSNQGLAGKAHSSCVSYWKSTRSFHVGPSRGWADIGYSFGACPHGYVLEGRGLDRQQAAQPGGNSTWYSCTLMSGPGEDPTEAQINAVRQLREWLMGTGVAGAVRGHRDFISTSCPGDRLYRLVQDGTFRKAAGSAAQEEDDMQPTDSVEVGEYFGPYFGGEHYPAGFLWVGSLAEAKRARQSAERLEAAVAKLAQSSGIEVDVDEDAIVAGVLAGLTPERIAAAIPEELAEQVVTALGERLSSA